MTARTSGRAVACVAMVCVASMATAGWPRVALGGPHTVPEAREPGQAVATHVEVLVLEGSDGPGGIAASVANVPQLHRPPFSAFRQIAERARTTLTLGPVPGTVQLPGGSATVTSTGRGADGRYAVVVQISRNGHTHAIHFAATPGDPFFTVTETGAQDALILGFTVR